MCFLVNLSIGSIGVVYLAKNYIYVYIYPLEFKRPIQVRSRVGDLLRFQGSYSGMLGSYLGNAYFWPKNACFIMF